LNDPFALGPRDFFRLKFGEQITVLRYSGALISCVALQQCTPKSSIFRCQNSQVTENNSLSK
jgi:hypothetical protein